MFSRSSKASLTFKQYSVEKPFCNSASRIWNFNNFNLFLFCCCLRRALFGLIVSTEHLTRTLSGEPLPVTSGPSFPWFVKREVGKRRGGKKVARKVGLDPIFSRDYFFSRFFFHASRSPS